MVIEFINAIPTNTTVHSSRRSVDPACCAVFHSDLLIVDGHGFSHGRTSERIVLLVTDFTRYNARIRQRSLQMKNGCHYIQPASDYNYCRGKPGPHPGCFRKKVKKKKTTTKKKPSNSRKTATVIAVITTVYIKTPRSGPPTALPPKNHTFLLG